MLETVGEMCSENGFEYVLCDTEGYGLHLRYWAMTSFEVDGIIYKPPYLGGIGRSPGVFMCLKEG